MANTTHAFKNTFSYKLIYVFAIADDAHSDCLKIGDTTLDTDLNFEQLTARCGELNKAANKRIAQYTKTAAVTTQLLHTELAIRNIGGNKRSFRDYDVHRVLMNSGFKRKEFPNKKLGKEWFVCDLESAIRAIDAVKRNEKTINTLAPFDKFIPVVFRPEQLEAIEKTVKQFKKSPRMLWNAKMRFGKTLCALEVVHRCKFKKTILITHRPVVDSGWHDDFPKIFSKEDKYRYGSKKNEIEIADLERTFKSDGANYIYFASIQDLRGSEIVGGRFGKNDDVFSIKWDCVIIDEAHEGTTTELGEKVKSILFKPEKGTKLLELSGTPFNILSNYDDEDSVFTWDYVMEQRAKKEWEETHFGDSNPYSDLPEMRMYTYDLGKILGRDFADIEDKAFNFAEFFKTDANGNFTHKKDVKAFLNLLCKEDETSLYPFSTEEYRDLFRHTLWMMPGVKEALALQHLLESHPVFCNFKVVNVAGDGDPEDPTGEALEAVRSAIKDSGEDGYTITLSCGKLTTGVSVPQWSAVLMLYGTYATKAAGYLQTIFRVQTPCNDYGKTKTTAYVFDFAPDRTLKMVSDAVSLSAKAGKTTLDAKIALGEFLNFCPVIGIDGSRMKKYEVAAMLQQLKRAYAERAVTKGFDDACLYNDELLKLTKVELKAFDDLKAIIGETKANKRTNEIDINSQGLTDEEYKKIEQGETREDQSLSPEQQELKVKEAAAKKQRQTAISVLRGISVRMPLLIYGADVPIEEEITLQKFVELVDEQSWQEFMPRGVTKEKFMDFTKYYDEDVFIAAGKKIRRMVLQADNLNMTERVKKIAEIFSCFKNPDKETVLTPWRVVNIHLNETLGGYSFFDADFKTPLAESEAPHFADIENITEKTLGNANARILEINSKTGLYPLYCAYSIFRAKSSCRSDRPTGAEETKDEKTSWQKTLEENIFVICKTPMAKAITMRTLAGFSGAKVNANCFEDLVNMLKNKSELFIKKVTSEKYWNKGNGNMEFDAVVGNPPYQEMDGGAQASATPVYQHFVDGAFKLNPKIASLIIPTRWYTGGKGLDAFRENMLNTKNLQVLHDFLTPEFLFPNTNIRGGVCYFLWNKNYDNSKNLVTILTHEDSKITNISRRPMKIEGLDIFIRDSRAISIIEKVKSKTKESFSDYVSPRKPFGFSTDFTKSEDFHTDNANMRNPIVCYCKGRKIGYVEKDKIVSHKEWIDKYKVYVARANNIGTELNDDNINSFGGEKQSVCTESYLCVGADLELDKSSAQNLEKYLSAKFFRFMHSLSKASQDATSKTFQFVPLQDFTETSDIDWSKPISEIDKQLYAKYGLSEEEIAFIERMIKEM